MAENFISLVLNYVLFKAIIIPMVWLLCCPFRMHPYFGFFVFLGFFGFSGIRIFWEFDFLDFLHFSASTFTYWELWDYRIFGFLISGIFWDSSIFWNWLEFLGSFWDYLG